MNTSDGWIKMTERKPTNEDLPILLWNAGVPKAKYSATADSLRSQLGLTCFSHWMKAPTPPAKELTQREKDEEAFREHHKTILGCYSIDSWRAALAYRDGQNREDLSTDWQIDYESDFARCSIASFKALRRRCGLDT